MRLKVALGLPLNKFRFYLGASLTVLNPDFTREICKSGLTFEKANEQSVKTDSKGG